MFERLISSPESHRAPSTVLSVQRRMRKNIADLTRDFYKDITEIIDHPKCSTKVIAEDFKRKNVLVLPKAQGEGLLAPCISPQIYFWSHSGTQGRADVGLSKVNKTEAEMVCSLTRFLHSSGVPKTSIAIITPYKGKFYLFNYRSIDVNSERTNVRQKRVNFTRSKGSKFRYRFNC